MTGPSSLLSSPRLYACLRSLSASSPARALSCLLNMINGPDLCQIARFEFIFQSLEVSCVPFCLLVGRWTVSWSSLQGRGGIFFPQICTWLPAFSCTSHKRPFIEIAFPWIFPSLFKTSFLRFLCKDIWRKLFAGFIWDRQFVYLKPTCVSWVDRLCAEEKKKGFGGWWGERDSRQMLAWLTPSRKYQKALYEVL